MLFIITQHKAQMIAYDRYNYWFLLPLPSIYTSQSLHDNGNVHS